MTEKKLIKEEMQLEIINLVKRIKQHQRDYNEVAYHDAETRKKEKLLQESLMRLVMSVTD